MKPNRSLLSRSFPFMFAASLLAGCVDGPIDGDDPDDPELGMDEQGLNNADPVASYAYPYTVRIDGAGFSCTGVIVGKRTVLSAAHCGFSLAMPSQLVVHFYGSGGTQTGQTVGVTSVAARPGVNPDTSKSDGGDLTDINGKFADVVVITLKADIPIGAKPAKMPLTYPGNNATGLMVGTGKHDNIDNSAFWIMKQLWDSTYSSDVNDGHFLINTSEDNKGDSGGPFFVGAGTGKTPTVQGVLFGNAWEWAYHGKYTSILYHLSWVLDQMNYDGGMTHLTGWSTTGQFLNLYPTSDWRVCALDCAQTTGCVAYNQTALSCMLLSTETGAVAQSGTVTGFH